MELPVFQSDAFWSTYYENTAPTDTLPVATAITYQICNLILCMQCGMQYLPALATDTLSKHLREILLMRDYLMRYPVARYPQGDYAEGSLLMSEDELMENHYFYQETMDAFGIAILTAFVSPVLHVSAEWIEDADEIAWESFRCEEPFGLAEQDCQLLQDAIMAFADHCYLLSSSVNVIRIPSCEELKSYTSPLLFSSSFSEVLLGSDRFLLYETGMGESMGEILDHYCLNYLFLRDVLQVRKAQERSVDIP